MPNNTRGQLKRQFDQAKGHVESAQAELAKLHDIYNEHHPDIAQQIMAVFAALETMLKPIEQIRDSI